MSGLKVNGILSILFACFFSQLLFAEAISVSAKRDVFVIDDFEDRDLKRSPTWWQFGDVFTDVVDNDQLLESYLEAVSLSVKGHTSNGYIGGCGAYFGIDGSKYDTLKFIMKSTKKTKGFMRIELYDDDNGTWAIEKDQKNTSKPGFDDRFVYDLNLDFDGWKVITIPFSKFYDHNPGIGDGIWNPEQINGSGGFLQMQLIFLSEKTKGNVDVEIDTIKVYKE